VRRACSSVTHRTVGAWALLAGVTLLLAACAPAATAKVRDAGTTTFSATGVHTSAPAATTDGDVCHSDEDCTLDLRPAGACCAGCEARAVTRAAQLRKNEECAAVRCAAPACVPPRTLAVAACVGGRCALRQESNQ